MTGEDWRASGNCAPRNWTGRPEDLDEAMYPTSGAGSTDRTERIRAHADGKAICAGCPVAAECLDEALRMEGGGGSGRWGVRGGLAPDERADVYRRRRK